MVGTSNPNSGKPRRSMVQTPYPEYKLDHVMEDLDDLSISDLIKPVKSLDLVKKQAILLRDILEDALIGMKQAEPEFKGDEEFEIEKEDLVQLIDTIDKTWPWLC